MACESYQATHPQLDPLCRHCGESSDAHQRQLIAELLEALKAVVVATEAADNPRDQGVSGDDDVIVQAKAVIAKAEKERH